MLKRLFLICAFLPLVLISAIQLIGQIVNWLVTGKSLYEADELILFKVIEG